MTHDIPRFATSDGGLTWASTGTHGGWRPAGPAETPGECIPEGVPPAPIDLGLPVGVYEYDVRLDGLPVGVYEYDVRLDGLPVGVYEYDVRLDGKVRQGGLVAVQPRHVAPLRPGTHGGYLDGDEGLTWAEQVAARDAEIDRLRAELDRWTSGRRRKAMPVVDAVPDGLHYAAALVRAQGTEGGEDHDQLLTEAGQRMKALYDAASALIAERDQLRADAERFRAHSVTFNSVAYRIADALADEDEKGQGSYFGDPIEEVDRLVADRDEWKATAERLRARIGAACTVWPDVMGLWTAGQADAARITMAAVRRALDGGET